MANLLDQLTTQQQGTSTTASATQQSLPEWYTSFIRDLAARGTQVAGQPYQQYEGARVAGFSPLQQQAFQMAPGVVTSAQPGLAQAQGALSQVLPQFQAGAANANDITSQAVQTAAQSGQGALGAVQQFGVPGAQAATGAAATANGAVAGPAATWDATARDKYMSPYTSSVVDEIGRLGNRNLTENIMPGVNGAFIGAGQFGSQANADILGRSIRDAQADISGKQAAALESGYKTAADMFSSDANRTLQQGQVQANTALQGGQLASGALGQLANLGSSTALGAGQLGANAQLQAGQVAGNLATQGGQLGTQVGGALGQLAGQTQTLGINGLTALGSRGGIQQQNQQQGLDTAYNDYLRAQGYDMSQLTALRGLVSGLQLPAGASTVTNAPNGAYSASPLDWVGALMNMGGASTTTPAGGAPSGGTGIKTPSGTMTGGQTPNLALAQ